MYANYQVKDLMIPSRSWQIIACDFFEYLNKDYLITVDYYSDYSEMDRLQNKTGCFIISKLKARIARLKIPETFVSDNKLPFNGLKFAEFWRTFEFNHVTIFAKIVCSPTEKQKIVLKL